MQQPPAVARMIFAVFGLVFLGVGLTLIGWMWLAPFGEFGSPPLIFRIFASFIAVAFIAMGGGIAYAAITGKLQTPGQGKRGDAGPLFSGRTGKEDDVGYTCPNCGAALSEDSDVSPHGDVKCTYCNGWFNIHV